MCNGPLPPSFWTFILDDDDDDDDYDDDDCDYDDDDDDEGQGHPCSTTPHAIRNCQFPYNFACPMGHLRRRSGLSFWTMRMSMTMMALYFTRRGRVSMNMITPPLFPEEGRGL